MADLVQELSSRGYRIGTIKHTHHQHELDTPGKDSHRHRQAGAAVIGVLSKSMNAAFWQPHLSNPSSSDDRYEDFAEFFSDCHLTFVEGDTHTTAEKIEVWRRSLAPQPLALTYNSITAVVTHDDCPNLAVPIWPRADVTDLADKILALVERD